MEYPIQVAICGQSIAWAAIEAVLHRLPHIHIVRCSAANLRAKLSRSPVDVILLDANTTFFKTDLPSVSGPTLLKLDFDSDRLIEPLNTNDCYPALNDLIQAIQGEWPVNQGLSGMG